MQRIPWHKGVVMKLPVLLGISAMVGAFAACTAHQAARDAGIQPVSPTPTSTTPAPAFVITPVSAGLQGKAANAVRRDLPDRPVVARPLGAARMTSGVTIPAGQVFTLGGGQRHGFTVEVTNRGASEIGVLVADEGALPRRVALVPAGETALCRFERGEAALLENSSGADEARARVLVWGGDASTLGMSYAAR